MSDVIVRRRTVKSNWRERRAREEAPAVPWSIDLPAIELPPRPHGLWSTI